MKKHRFWLLLLMVLSLFWGIDQGRAAPVTGPGTVPDYWETPNWANSPPLRKFVDTLPGLNAAAVNNLGQYIPVAIPDTLTYPGSDYYEIELGEYTKQMHSDLPPTKLRGYRQTNTTDPTVSQFQYLGPLIMATKDRPVRVKFTNKLPTGAGGNLFLPVDTTVMGSGMGPLDSAGNPCDPAVAACAMYTQNRATLHLHGGRSPWVSDGTPHQWITPAGEATPYPKGVSVQNVPDMPDPGPGSETFYWTNQQSARLMFYHDHAWGITRLNVYAGEAAGYLLTDPKEQELVTAALVPADQVPLVIQFKTFVDATTIGATDPTWNWGTGPRDAQGNITAAVTGDLWWPHVYMPAQNPFVMSGVADLGRWMYGPWFWPPTPVCGSSPTAVKPWCISEGTKPNPYYDPNCVPDPTLVANNNFCQPPEIPGTPNVSWGAEAFLDTAVVNGTAFPSVTVNPQAYRFRILNADHDKFLNLQFYKASPIVGAITLTANGSGYTAVPAVTITNAAGDTTGKGATATATVDLTVGSPTFGQVTAINLTTVGSGYTAAPSVTIAPPATAGGAAATATATLYTNSPTAGVGMTEVGMVPAVLTSGFPATWPIDGREGGVPDPTQAGPAFIQIGTEGGFLPAPVLMPNQPVQWNANPTMFNFGNVLNQADGGGTLMLGPAERADVIVDFSNYAGQTLILYNDAPSAWPALDPHYDYYTGAPDRTGMGGYGPIPPGVGPNVRTIMQIKVSGAGGTAPVDDYNPTTLTNLQAAFASTATTQGVFAASQEPIIAGQSAYNSAYNKTFPFMWPYWGYSRIFDTSLGFQSVAGVNQTVPMQPKAIHDEMGGTFDDYGRMAARLGLEVPGATAAISTFALQNFVDPPTEITQPGAVQVWKITHNGVDTHPVHFHLFDVQLINRVGWDGFIRTPDPNELGWKETIRTSPLEDTIVALRPVLPAVPFGLPNSVRPLNPSVPLGSDMGFSQIDPLTGGALAVTQTNVMQDFKHEYVWHCHILSHEENDMMRSVVFNVPSQVPAAAGSLTAVLSGVAGSQQAALAWTDPTPVGALTQLGNPQNEVGFRIERAVNGVWTAIGTAPANTTTFTDTALASGTTYQYRVIAFNAAGDAPASNTATVTTLSDTPVAPSNLVAAATAPTVTLTWTDNSTNETGFTIQRARNIGFTTGLTTFTAAANATSFVDNTVAANTTYYYRVRADNGAVFSTWSNTATVTAAGQGPAAPSNLTVTGRSRTQITLQWTDNSNNEQGFQIFRSTTGAPGSFTQIAQVPRNGRQYQNSGLRRNTTYYYYVVAFNASGVSAASNTVTATTLP